jgi:RNA polymerase sigma-70 factor (ECF subfamily)
MNIRSSLKFYLLRAVRNSFLDEVRHNKVKLRYQADLMVAERSNSLDTMNYVLFSDAEENIRKALEMLDKGEREVFVSSRFDHLKYSEIAKKMNISVRTVEVRMSKAVNKLKSALGSLAIFLTGIFN